MDIGEQQRVIMVEPIPMEIPEIEPADLPIEEPIPA